MLTYVQTIVLGFLQGITELFPISSLGHSVLIPALLHWQINEASDQFLSFVVLTHLATVLVLFVIFWRDWVRVIFGILHSLYTRSLANPYAKLGWLLVVSTIPGGILGFLLQSKIQALFGAPALVAGVLVLNGLVLYIAERLRRHAKNEDLRNDKALAGLSFRQAFGIGLAQCLALIPGFSRTGLTMTGGLLSELTHEEAARYSFLLATPIIFAASVLKVPGLFKQGHGDLPQALVGALCAAVGAYIGVKFLLRYFQTKTFTPFALYCVLAGLAALALLTF